MSALTIAFHTVKQARRGRMFHSLLLFALIMIAAAILVGNLSLGMSGKIIQDTGLASILLFGSLVAILMGTHLVSKELEQRTLYFLLSKPIRRGELLLGKYLGLCMVLLVSVILMSGFLILVLWLHRTSWDVSLFKAILLIYAELTLLAAIALLFSTIASPMLSGIFTLLTYLMGYVVPGLKELTATSQSIISRDFLAALSYVIPPFGSFDIRAEAVHAIPVTNGYILGALLYSLVYSAFLMSASVLVFQRRELD